MEVEPLKAVPTRVVAPAGAISPPDLFKSLS